ncbi:MAG: zinc ABC transporter substrate-binding protein [Bacteroidales bacterium]|nr:zinc ABC transporter substrate-binding protein [Bacteroidales bacterium]
MTNRRNLLTNIVPFLFLAACLLLPTSCKHKTPADNRPVITVSIEPLRQVVEQLVEGRYRVVTIMPQGASPESYEPTPRQMVELAESRMLFCVGTLGFEKTRLQQMTEIAPEVPVVRLSDGIEMLEETAGCDTEHETDPHVWMCPDNMCQLVENACEALCRIDSANASHYRLLAEKQMAQYRNTDLQIQSALKKLSHRTFLIYHPALGYFAHRYGLKQVAVEQEGKEPSAAYLQQLENLCRAEKVKVVFISKEHTGRAARRLAESLGARVVEINPLSDDVNSQFFNIVEALNHE